MSRVLCIVHSADAVPWATFIKNLFHKQQSPKYEVRSVLDTVLAQSSPSSTRQEVEDAEVLVVVLSPEHLLFLCDHPDFTYHELGSGGQKGVLLFCGTSPSDMECKYPDGRDLRARFPSYKDWAALEHSDVSSLPSILEKIQPLSSLIYQLIPDRVRCENDSAVTVSFSEVIAAKPTDLQMALYITKDDGVSEENVEVTWMNDKAVFFKAPERREGPVKVRIVVKGNQVPGTSSLRYESSCELVSEMMQLYIYAMNHLISLVLSQTVVSNSELDNCLFQIFSEDEPKGIQPKVFEELFGIYRYNPNMKSQVELPTLLHFANKFGFEKFNSWLKNLPDAELASKIQSCDGLQAEKVNRFKAKAIVPPAFPQPSFGPPVVDDLPEEPEEDYLDMETTTRIRFENMRKASADNIVWKPDVPIAEEYQIDQESFEDIYTTVGADSEEDYEDFYEPIDRPCDFRSETIVEEQDICPSQTTTSQVDRPAPQSGATMDPGQQKLIEIMTQVKCGELTMEEANILFNEWKIQHKPSQPNLVSRSKQSPYEMNTPIKPPVIMKDAKAGLALPDPPLPSWIGRKRGSDFSDKHSSTASSSSFDSSRSSTASFSHSSGIDVEPLEEDLSSRRSSSGSTDGSSVAPPLPVRPTPSKLGTLPRTVPGLSKSEGPSGKNNKDKLPRPLPPRR